MDNFFKGFGGFWSWVGQAAIRLQEKLQEPINVTKFGDALFTIYCALVYIVEGREVVIPE